MDTDLGDADTLYRNDDINDADTLYSNDIGSDGSYKSAVSQQDAEEQHDGRIILTALPTEIIHHILSHLGCEQLLCLARTCRKLKPAAEAEILWINLLREHIPPEDFPATSPSLSPSYRHLYKTHHPYWFLPRHKIWMSDSPHVGRLMLCKFDPRRGCIESYRILAMRGDTTVKLWSYNPTVVIHSFSPRVYLWLDDPILTIPHETTYGRQNWRESEIGMTSGWPGSASFFLSRDIPEKYQGPNTALWPPRNIPDMPRARTASQNGFVGKEHKPQRYDEISQTTFRTRAEWGVPGVATVGTNFFSADRVYNGKEVTVWSTLDPKLYTPTKEKPYQGIFVGDYAGHGCEFLLVLQTERAPPAPIREGPSEYADLYHGQDPVDGPLHDPYYRLTVAQNPVEPNLNDDAAHVGSIEAIKLTGDPNVPRGEHTFISDDIGPNGFLRVAAETPFRGARVVRSRGHVAAGGYQRDDWLPSQLFLISPDKMAQYWVPFGHISFYNRVDLDKLGGWKEPWSSYRTAGAQSR